MKAGFIRFVCLLPVVNTIIANRFFTYHPLRFMALVLALLTQTVPAADALRVLNENCMRCHGAEKRKGGLAMNSRAALLKGGDTGDALNLENPSESLLLELLLKDADPHMPPKKQLSDAEIAAVADWIKAGAHWDEKAFAKLPAARDVSWRPLPASYRPIGALAVSPGGERLAIAKGADLRVMDLGSKNATNKVTLKASRDALQSVSWHPDGQILATGGFRRVVIWDAKTGEKLKVIKSGLLGRITSLEFVRGGKQLVLGESLPTLVGRLVVLDTGTWRTQTTIRAHTDSIYDLALSPDGKVMASSSADKLTHLWNVDTWKSAGTLEGHLGYVMSSAFSPASDRIATVSADSTVKVWEVKTRKQISTFSDRGSLLAVTGIHWTLNPASDKPKADDDWIITVSEDSKPRLYTKLLLHDGGQRSTGAKMRAWSPAAAGCTTLAFSPAIKQVFAGDVDGGVTIWDINGKLLKRIE